MSPGQTTTEAYLRRIRRRALALVGVRATGAGVASALACVALAALVVGPLPVPAVAGAVLVVSVACGGWCAWRQARRAAPLRGAGITAWLAGASPELASRARTVLELSDGAAQGSAELVQAHRRQVERELAALPVHAAAPVTRVLPPGVALMLCATLLCSGLALQSARGRVGVFGLMHAFDDSASTERRADLVAGTAATLRFPAYRGRETVELRGADAIEAPHGTSVGYRVRFHSQPARASLRLPAGDVRLAPLSGSEADGVWWGADFVASSAGAIEVLVLPSEGESWASDRRTRSLRVTPDTAPAASLAGPDDGELPLDLPTRIGFAATDDVGVTEVSLLILRPDGTEDRRRLAAHTSAEAQLLVQGSAEILPLDLGAQAGDSLTLTLEVHDGDTLTGPHVTRSEPLALRVASEGSRRLELLAGLEALLGIAIDTLAARLETPLNRDDRSDATDLARHARLSELDQALLRALRTYATAQGTNDAPLSQQAQRLERGIQREARAYRGRGAAQREQQDEQQTAVLEDLVIALDAFRVQARLADAAELALELLALRRELASLLAELRRADTEEARLAVAAAIGRARDRLAQLAQRIAEIDPTQVAPEFSNQEQLQREATDALGALDDALRNDDLDAAERSMHDLERQIDQLVASLGQVEQDYTEEHFGARDRAMAEALDALNGLETEQRALAERTDRARRSAAARALEAMQSDGPLEVRRVRDEISDARRQLDSVPEGGMGARDRDTLSRTRQRLVDALDALETGDVSEARRMVAEARAESIGLARDLDLSALMFAGANGRTAQAAEQVGAAARQIAQAEARLDESIPNLRSFLDAEEAAQLRSDSARQERAGSATEGLAGRFRDGPGGEALSDDAAAALEAVRGQMQVAERALRRLDAVEAGAQQAQAAEALRELREELEQQSRGGGGGSNGGGRGAGTAPPSQRVAIPTADEHEGPVEFRRRVLDAMEQRAPGGYEDATRRYYERLLR
ncbi:MAG: DUF4175 family protein [Sandaracinaceae bacterium]|nr:DUF4175 family protein [Sandaracinaceae bacterium]